MTLQEIIKRLKQAKDDLWYAKHSEIYSSDYINSALDEIESILKAVGAME